MQKQDSGRALYHKLGIDALNPMQEAMGKAVGESDDVVLLSPTGTGKTLAFLLPLLELMEKSAQGPQMLITVPARELALQIETVLRDLGSGFKVNAVYGGRPITKDFSELKTTPDVLIGTPGRIADHLRRGTFDCIETRFLVLDEFDKSLEVGFETEMKFLLENCEDLDKRILTSATKLRHIPGFVGLSKPVTLDFTQTQATTKADLYGIPTEKKDKLPELVETLKALKGQRGIVFFNYKESIERTAERLREEGIGHGVYYGGMEQIERERALMKFRNGSTRVLLATDLAARGLDVPEVNFIIHFQLPLKEAEFIHRNGRTARMHASGAVYALLPRELQNPFYLPELRTADFTQVESSDEELMATVFISAGRKDKLSKGDIAGMFIKQANIPGNKLGLIELKQDCAFVAVPQSLAKDAVRAADGQRIKKRKVRVRII